MDFLVVVTDSSYLHQAGSNSSTFQFLQPQRPVFSTSSSHDVTAPRTWTGLETNQPTDPLTTLLPQRTSSLDVTAAATSGPPDVALNLDRDELFTHNAAASSSENGAAASAVCRSAAGGNLPPYLVEMVQNTVREEIEECENRLRHTLLHFHADMLKQFHFRQVHYYFQCLVQGKTADRDKTQNLHGNALSLRHILGY